MNGCNNSKFVYTRNFHIEGTPQDDSFWYGDEEGYAAFFVPGPKFGCVHWETIKGYRMEIDGRARFVDDDSIGVPLSDHEKSELAEDFDIHVDGKYIVIALTRDEYNLLKLSKPYKFKADKDQHIRVERL